MWWRKKRKKWYNKSMCKGNKTTIETILKKQIGITRELVDASGRILRIALEKESSLNQPLHRTIKDEEQ